MRENRIIIRKEITQNILDYFDSSQDILLKKLFNIGLDFIKDLCDIFGV